MTKKLWIVAAGLFLCPNVLFAQQGGPLFIENACINDHAKIVSRVDQNTIRSLCQRAKQNNIELMVVTVPSYNDLETRGMSMDFFVDMLFDDWDISYNSRSKAILLFVANKEHEIRIRIGNEYTRDTWNKVVDIMNKTIGPGLGSAPSAAIRKGFVRLYHEVVESYLQAVEKEKKEKEKLQEQKDKS